MQYSTSRFRTTDFELFKCHVGLVDVCLDHVDVEFGLFVLSIDLVNVEQ